MTPTRSWPLLAILSCAAACQAQEPPAEYRRAIRANAAQKHNENDLRAFVHHLYAQFDRHAPFERISPLFLDHGLEVSFPAPQPPIRSHQQLGEWYAGIGRDFASNVHTLERLEVSLLGGQRYAVSLVVRWEAESRQGSYVRFRAAQEWTLEDGPGPWPRIRSYRVRDADASPPSEPAAGDSVGFLRALGEEGPGGDRPVEGALAALMDEASPAQLRARLQALRAAGALDRRGASGLTLALQAAALGRTDVLEELADLGADLSVTSAAGATLAHLGAQAPARAGQDRAAVLRWLAERDPSLFAGQVRTRIPGNGHTPAMEAVFQANEEAARFLLEARARGVPVDFDAPAVTHWTPRGFALREGYPWAERLPVPAGWEQAFAAGLPAVREEVASRGRLADQRFLEALPAGERRLQEAGGAMLAAASRPGASLAERVAEVRAREAELRSYGVGQPLRGTWQRLGATVLHNLMNAPTPPGYTEAQRAQELTTRAELQRLLLGLPVPGSGQAPFADPADPSVAETGLMQVPVGFREAVFGHEQALANLIEHYRARRPGELQAFLDAQGPLNGYTKLIDACLRGRAGVVRLLVQAGADARLRGHNGLDAAGALATWNAQHPEASLDPALLR